MKQRLAATTASFEQLRDTLFVAEATTKSMRGNRSTDTIPEQRLRKGLWKAGLRGYRKNVVGLPGKPDIVFGKVRLAIFVHGCFWHRCPDCNLRTPGTNERYWSAKFESNVRRDKRRIEELKDLGYETLTVWECRIEKDLSGCIQKVREAISARSNSNSAITPCAVPVIPDS